MSSSIIAPSKPHCTLSGELLGFIYSHHLLFSILLLSVLPILVHIFLKRPHWYNSYMEVVWLPDCPTPILDKGQAQTALNLHLVWACYTHYHLCALIVALEWIHKFVPHNILMARSTSYTTSGITWLCYCFFTSSRLFSGWVRINASVSFFHLFHFKIKIPCTSQIFFASIRALSCRCSEE